MPIHIDSETGEVTVHFIGTDIIAGLCGNEAGEVDSVGIAAVDKPGEPGQPAPEDLEAEPFLYLRFETPAALESFMSVLEETKQEKFGA